MKSVSVEIFIPGELKDKPIICEIIKKFDISLKIIEASFSTESGWAYLVLEGEENILEDILKYLKNEGVSTEIR